MEGIARYIFETTRQMVLNHPEDTFHFIFDRPFDDKFIFADNIIPHVLSPPARHPLLWYVWYEWRIPALLKKIKAEVFLSGDMYLSLSTEVPSIMVSHDINYEHHPENLPLLTRKFLLHYSKKYHHKADHLIAVSQATKDDLSQFYQLDPQKITIAHNATPEGFSILKAKAKQSVRDQITEGLPYFVYVGSLHPRKNVSRLLKAFDLFKKENNSDHKLVVYGRIAWKTSSIFEIYEALEFKDDIIFLGDDTLDVPQVMGAAAALCYVSLFEGFGIPILEAFECGVPVITSNLSSMPEVAGEAALLVDPHEVKDIAKAMHQIATDDLMKQELIQKGKVQKEKFSWERSADTIYDQLKKLV